MLKVWAQKGDHLKGRSARERAGTEKSQGLICPRGETLEVEDTKQGGQEMVFKGYLGGKTDLARDHKK